jgi:hypothetical protein
MTIAILIQVVLLSAAVYCIFVGGLESFMIHNAGSSARKHAILGIILLIAFFAVPYVTGVV